MSAQQRRRHAAIEMPDVYAAIFTRRHAQLLRFVCRLMIRERAGASVMLARAAADDMLP